METNKALATLMKKWVDESCDTEIWVKVKGYPDYEVSNWGRVYNKSSQQYLVCKDMVTLRKGEYYGDGIALDRLVAIHFVPCEGNYQHYYVRHKDGDDENCRADNLYWDKKANPTNQGQRTKEIAFEKHGWIFAEKDGRVYQGKSNRELAKIIGVSKSSVDYALRVSKDHIALGWHIWREKDG